MTGRSAYVTNIKEAALIVKWSPLGDSYAVAVGNKVVVYKLATAALSFTMEFSRYVLALEFLSENMLAVGGEFEGLKILDIGREQCIQTLEGHATRVKDLGTTDDLLREDKKQLLLFSVSSDGDLRCWAFNPENFEEEAKLVARFEVPGRPTCLTVIGRKTLPKRLETTTDETKMAVRSKKPLKAKKNKDNGKTGQATVRTSGDEPKKKKLKSKKKKSTKKRDEGSKKCAEEEVVATDGEKETEGMELNESGGSELNDDED